MRLEEGRLFAIDGVEPARMAVRAGFVAPCSLQVER
jgi:hypothetical protein